VLQIRRMLRQRSSRDVSVGYFTILLVGFGLWIGCGIASRNLALLVPDTLALLIGAPWTRSACERPGHEPTVSGSLPVAPSL
jgi:uncharacterized protein with PQ loop repeat